jgi:uncharacterized protein (UPF0333 family)
LSRQKLIIVLVVVVIVVIVGASVIWTCLTPNQPNPTPELTIQEQARDAAISYIQTNHAETAPLMTNFNWAGGRQDTGLLGAETYIYNSTNWTVTINYPVIPNPTYTINATYSSGNTTVAWQGTYQNSTITETSYTFTP